MNNSEGQELAEKSLHKNDTLWSGLKNKSWLRIIIGAVLGAIVGVFYWELIGCNGGSCPLTNNLHKTVIFFTVVGGFMARKR